MEENTEIPNRSKKKITRVYSEAFPPNILGKTDKIPSYSNVHKHFSEQNFQMDRIHYRELKPYDKEELMLLHKEWFPIEYTDEYFDRLIQPIPDKIFITILATYYFDDQEYILGAVIAEINSTEEFLSQLPQEYYKDIDIPFFETINFFRSTLEFGYIMIIGVIDEMRKKNLGTILIDKISEEFMKRRYCYCIYLHVVNYNTMALKFYEKNKFVKVSTIKNHYKIRNNFYDCEVLVKFFKWSHKSKIYKESIFYFLFKWLILNPVNFVIFLLTLGFLFKLCRKKYKLD